MDYLRGVFVAACIAVAGAGGGVIALSYDRASPRLMLAATVAVVLGIGFGGYALGAGLRRKRD